MAQTSFVKAFQIARTDFSGHHDEIRALALVGNDRLVAAGGSWLQERDGPYLESSFVLACYAITGVPRGPDFDLTFGESVIYAQRGSKAKVAVKISRVSGFTGDVTITPPDLTAEGIICKYPEPITASSDKTKWSFKIKGTVSQGPHTLTFAGRDSAGREHTATIILFVE